MKYSAPIYAAVLFLMGRQEGFPQGFINLDFENSIPTNVVTLGPGVVVGDAIIPGWVAYLNGSPTTIVRFNAQSSNGGVALIGTAAVPPIQGNYFIMLNGAAVFQGTAGIGQTGTIPSTAQSLIFWGNVGANDVTFEGQILPLTVLESTNNYNVYGADISAFANQSGELLFTVESHGQDSIDNIQFSSAAVPEPDEFGLTVIGSLLLGFSYLRKWQLRAV